MWNTLVIGAVASLMLAMTASVQAEGSWCVNKGGTGSVNCGFYSFQQCMASVSGGTSFCTQNGFTGLKMIPAGALDVKVRQSPLPWAAIVMSGTAKPVASRLQIPHCGKPLTDPRQCVMLSRPPPG